jgi:glycosyltransferase involved in cell wall biosynthesis
MKKINVLYITTAFSRSESDTVTPWLTKTVLLLKNKKNINVDVLTSSYKGLQSHTINGLKVYRFRYFFSRLERLTHEKCVPEKLKESPFLWVLVPFYMFFGTLATIRLVLKNKYNIIHVHWPFPHFFFTLIPKMFFQIKIISSFHGTGPKWVQFNIPQFKPLFKFIIKYSDLITVNSSYTRDKIINKIKEGNVKIVPFGSAIDEEKINYEVEPNKLLFVGRLVGRKGINYLIEAMALLKEEYPDLKLSIVGDGPQKSNLEKLIKKLNLEDKITLFGALPPNKLGYHYKTCSIFILPSIIDEIDNTETLGVVLIEALTYKKPAIASEVGGIVDIIKDKETGLLVKEKNSEELAHAIRTLLSNPKLAKSLGEKGYKHIQNNFSWDSIIKNLSNYYQETLNYK